MFQRRVPKDIAHLDKRGTIRQTLKTKDWAVAALKARALNEALEQYWGALQRGEDAATSWDRHEAAVTLARSLGFTYRPAADLVAEGATPQLLERLRAVNKVLDQPAAVNAVLGTTEAPVLRLSNLYGVYAEHNSLKLSAMSPGQLRIHKGQRVRSIEYAKEVMGDKALHEIVRGDVVALMKFWEKKILAEGLTVEAPNKCFSNLKGMLTVVDRALQTDYRAVWSDTQMTGTAATKAKERASYSREFVETQLLRQGALDGMNVQARMALYIMLETGLRPSEIVNLRPHQFVMGGNIPHIVIEEREDRVLKSDNAVRTIPLVGVALWAGRQVADTCFPDYFDNASNWSAATNKFLRENGLRPTERHTAYSARHAFQDRITAAWVPDRVQVDLMGHALDREKYGQGASLEQKLEVLLKIQYACAWAE